MINFPYSNVQDCLSTTLYEDLLTKANYINEHDTKNMYDRSEIAEVFIEGVYALNLVKRCFMGNTVVPKILENWINWPHGLIVKEGKAPYQKRQVEVEILSKNRKFIKIYSKSSNKKA